MPYQVQYDDLLVPARRNDNPSSKIYEGKIFTGWRDGFAAGYIDGHDYRPILSDFSLRRCDWIKVSRDLLPLVQSLSNGEGSYDANGRQLPTRLAFDRNALSALTLKDVSGNTVDTLSSARNHSLTLPIDGSKLTGSIFLDLSKKVYLSTAELLDKLAVSAGTYLVGSGVGDHYPTYGGAGGYAADLADSTGALVGRQNSNITETAAALYSINHGAYTFTIDSASPPNGNPTTGHICSVNGNLVMHNLQIDGTGGVYFTGLYNKQLAASTGVTLVSTFGNANSFTLRVSECLVDGMSNGTRAIYINDSDNVVSIWNCMVWDFKDAATGAIHTQAFNSFIMENVSVLGSGLENGISLNNLAATIRNCVSMGCAVDYTGIGNATGRYNRDSDGTAANANWATGVGNGTTTVAGAWCAKGTDFGQYFLQPGLYSTIKGAGEAVTIPGHTTYIDGTALDSPPNIGAKSTAAYSPLVGAGEVNTLSRPTCIRGRTVPGPYGTSIGAAEYQLSVPPSGTIINIPIICNFPRSAF